MRKKNVIGALLCSACLAVGSLAPAFTVSADAMRVVTLGADLSKEQMNTMLRYFKVNADEVEIMYITNEDEREHLSDYVPLSQIGTRTVSCAYVRPTDSGGIKVRTANLNWVTGNMIASTLSTSGVKNCEVIAACPFEVSGTGALTGIQMAYEKASGEKLDEEKKQIATEEIVVTGNLADEVGKNDATTVINQSKMEVIENNVQNADEIYNIVQNIAQQNNVTVDQEQLDQIVALLEQIAEQGYVYEDVKDTLEHVDENVTGENSAAADDKAESAPDGGNGDAAAQSEEQKPAEPEDKDSIMNDVDESVLGEDIKASSTEDPTLEQETGAVQEPGEELTETTEPGEELTETTEPGEDLTETTEPGEDLTETTEPGADMSGTTAPEEDLVETTEPTDDGSDDMLPLEDYNEEFTEVPEDGSADAHTDEGTEEQAGNALDKTLLSEQQLSMFEQAEKFCTGEYQGDLVALQEVLGAEAQVKVTIETETGKTLAEAVTNAYFKVLTDPAYAAAETTTYLSDELNAVYEQLQKLFGMDGKAVEGEDILADVTPEDKQILFDDTVKFFETLYGEMTFEDPGTADSTEAPAEGTETTAEEGAAAEAAVPEEVNGEATGLEDVPVTEEVYE